MTQTRNLLCALALGILTLTATRSLAFPLYLTVSGTITATAHYGTDAGTTSNKVETGSVSMKNILDLVSNEFYLRDHISVPASSRIAYDPYTANLFLTNSSGFATNISSSIAEFYIDSIATTFHGSSNGNGTESDLIGAYFGVYGTAADGKYYEFDIYGMGTLHGSLDSISGKGNLSISFIGGGYGAFKSSASGVSKGNITFTGSGIVPSAALNEPYSVWWYNHDR